MKKLYELINELSMLLANHVIYMNNLKKAIREGEPFEHKDCHACSFGKMWDYRASREYLNRAYAKAYRTENHVKS